MNTMIYLYLKTHNITGLKYLGKTKNNPYTYMGSGKYWRRHIQKHGYDVTTDILLETEDPEEIKKAGLAYSRKHDIINSEEYANLIKESGDGGDTWIGLSPQSREDRISKFKLKTKGIGRTDEQIENIFVGANSIDTSYSGKDKKDNRIFKGRKHKEESIKKIKENNRIAGSKKDIERNSNLTKRSYNKGISKTEEHKAKLSESNRGNIPTNARRIVIDGEIFIGMAAAARHLGIPYSTMRNRISSRNIYYSDIYDEANPKYIKEDRVFFLTEH